jgi:hypothetical protein
VAITEKDVNYGLSQQILHLNRGTEHKQHYQFVRIVTPKSYKQAENTVYEAVSEVMLQCGTRLIDLTAMVDYEVFPCRYTFYVEIGYPVQDGVECSQMLLDNALCRTNLRNLSLGQIDRLGQLALRVVRPGTFEKLKKALLDRGTSASQVRIPRVIRNRELASLLMANTLHPASDTLLAG